MNYFNDRLKESNEDLLEDVTAAILREYVLWCANDMVKYEGHPYKEEYAGHVERKSDASEVLSTLIKYAVYLIIFFALMYFVIRYWM